MEADIILDGFRLAEKMHGLRYMWLVGDGDSSVYAKIHEEIPVWGIHVQKLECSNHVCKCLRSNLEKLVDANPHYKGRNNLTKAVRIRLVSAVRCAIRIRSKEENVHNAIIKLEKDIRNSVHHIFGNHNNCSDFCKAKLIPPINQTTSYTNDSNEVDEPSDLCIQNNLLWEEGTSLKDQELSRYSLTLSYSDLKSDMLSDISVLLDRVANKSKRLINNTTTNLAECWMHMRTKFDGGKVYNLCNRGSWHTRCYGGCLRMNVGPQWSPTVWKQVTDSSPGYHFIKLYEERDKQLTISNQSKSKPQAQSNRWKRKVSSANESTSKSAKSSYGNEAIQCEDDVDTSVLNTKCDQFMSHHINISNDKINAITTLTEDQSNSQVWHQERRKRITASNLGLTLKRKTSISVKNIVEQLLYKTFKGNEFTLFGLQQERNTIHEYI
ncbi:uncharacterized protein LOC127853067 [Dreissena polymorpha]|uniref:uncharacterized protein LOC127853067 n=1 Tax=Dreissena polymorpha TaxID=45954 RepID=UPI002264487F|nr:uncharacterized protein LOC127853067 [Dreissena polymorpha]